MIYPSFFFFELKENLNYLLTWQNAIILPHKAQRNKPHNQVKYTVFCIDYLVSLQVEETFLK